MQMEIFNTDLSLDGSLLKEHITKMTFIATLQIDGDRLSYVRSPLLRGKDLNNDLVYYMVCKGQLMKIGKAGGKTAWNGRVGMYKNGITPRGDGTNARIFRIMEERGLMKETIHVFGIYTPPTAIDVVCPLTGKVTKEEVQVHGNVERSLTAQFLEEGYELPFSNQLQ